MIYQNVIKIHAILIFVVICKMNIALLFVQNPPLFSELDSEEIKKTVSIPRNITTVAYKIHKLFKCQHRSTN